MMIQQAPRQHPLPVYGAYCPRCNRTYETTQVPLPALCDWCQRGGATAHDMPMGLTWVTS
jgi:hypothetical protein